MDGDGAKWLKDFIETMPTLKVLKAGSCKLEDQSCTVIQNAFKKCKNIKLEEIDLNTNNITGDGFKALFEGLSTMNSIQTINL